MTQNVAVSVTTSPEPPVVGTWVVIERAHGITRYLREFPLSDPSWTKVKAEAKQMARAPAVAAASSLAERYVDHSHWCTYSALQL